MERFRDMKREGRNREVGALKPEVGSGRYGHLSSLSPQNVNQSAHRGRDRVGHHASSIQTRFILSPPRILFTTSMPAVTWPKTVCFRSRCGCGE